MSKGNEKTIERIWFLSASIIIQPLCPFLYFRLPSFVSVSPCLGVRLGWTGDADVPLAGFSLHHYTSTLRLSFSGLLPECALLHSQPFDVNGNSWLREIWWKVSRPVFTPGQMALNKLGEKTQIRFSQKGLI